MDDMFIYDRGDYEFEYTPLPRGYGLPPWANPPNKVRKRQAHKKRAVSAKQKARKKKK